MVVNVISIKWHILIGNLFLNQSYFADDSSIGDASENDPTENTSALNDSNNGINSTPMASNEASVNRVEKTSAINNEESSENNTSTLDSQTHNGDTNNDNAETLH